MRKGEEEREMKEDSRPPAVREESPPVTLDPPPPRYFGLLPSPAARAHGRIARWGWRVMPPIPRLADTYVCRRRRRGHVHGGGGTLPFIHFLPLLARGFSSGLAPQHRDGLAKLVDDNNGDFSRSVSVQHAVFFLFSGRTLLGRAPRRRRDKQRRSPSPSFLFVAASKGKK